MIDFIVSYFMIKLIVNFFMLEFIVNYIVILGQSTFLTEEFTRQEAWTVIGVLGVFFPPLIVEKKKKKDYLNKKSA